MLVERSGKSIIKSSLRYGEFKWEDIEEGNGAVRERGSWCTTRALKNIGIIWDHWEEKT